MYATAKLDGMEELTIGVADSVALALVPEWKSDVGPSPATVDRYSAQFRSYVGATGARIVFASAGWTSGSSPAASSPRL